MKTDDKTITRVCTKCRHKNPLEADACVGCGAPFRRQPVKNPPADAEDAAQLVGRVINEKYKVLSVLGEGGMGVVYKVQHLLLRRRNLFALKVLHPRFSKNQHFRSRFLREGEVAMVLTHEHIVQVRDFGLTRDNDLFFTMDYFDGESLRALIDRTDRTAQERAVGIVRQVLTALREAHRRGIVHRDLKPDNILVRCSSTGEDQVKILDFGIAKILDDTRKTGNTLTRGGIVGSPRYMSPEQVSGDPVDGRSDLYSLGVILYELLTGKSPFTAKTVRGVLMQHLSKRAPRFEKVCPGIQVRAELEHLVLTLLEKNPNRRPENPQAVLKILDGESTLIETPVRPRRRRVVRSMALLVILWGLVWVAVPNWRPSRMTVPDWVVAPDWAAVREWLGKKGWLGRLGLGTESASAGSASSGARSGESKRPMRLRCRICDEIFSDGELEGNTHHDLPLEGF